MSYTKGPWTSTKRDGFRGVLKCAAYEIEDPHGPYWVAVVINEENAKLIAAAPDMAEALVAFREAYLTLDHGANLERTIDAYSKARAALDKAGVTK